MWSTQAWSWSSSGGTYNLIGRRQAGRKTKHSNIGTYKGCSHPNHHQQEFYTCESRNQLFTLDQLKKKALLEWRECSSETFLFPPHKWPESVTENVSFPQSPPLCHLRALGYTTKCSVSRCESESPYSATSLSSEVLLMLRFTWACLKNKENLLKCSTKLNIPTSTSSALPHLALLHLHPSVLV